jgi:hypothetical protein
MRRASRSWGGDADSVRKDPRASPKDDNRGCAALGALGMGMVASAGNDFRAGRERGRGTYNLSHWAAVPSPILQLRWRNYFYGTVVALYVNERDKATGFDFDKMRKVPAKQDTDVIGCRYCDMNGVIKISGNSGLLG